MASLNAEYRHSTIPELKKELDRMSALIYDEDQKCEQITYEAQLRSCYIQRELQNRGVR